MQNGGSSVARAEKKDKILKGTAESCKVQMFPSHIMDFLLNIIVNPSLMEKVIVFFRSGGRLRYRQGFIS